MISHCATWTYHHSGLNERITLADFDWRVNPKLLRADCFQLHTFKFVAEGHNPLIISKPGTGKIHVTNAVAYQATLQGHKVRYLETDGAFGRFALGGASEQRRQLRTLLDAEPTGARRSVPGLGPDAIGVVLVDMVRRVEGLPETPDPNR
ncbi:MAG: ATP-binding protein [Pseudomonadota bacterium]